MPKPLGHLRLNFDCGCCYTPFWDVYVKDENRKIRGSEPQATSQATSQGYINVVTRPSIRIIASNWSAANKKGELLSLSMDDLSQLCSGCYTAIRKSVEHPSAAWRNSRGSVVLEFTPFFQAVIALIDRMLPHEGGRVPWRFLFIFRKSVRTDDPAVSERMEAARTLDSILGTDFEKREGKSNQYVLQDEALLMEGVSTDATISFRGIAHYELEGTPFDEDMVKDADIIIDLPPNLAAGYKDILRESIRQDVETKQAALRDQNRYSFSKPRPEANQTILAKGLHFHEMCYNIANPEETMHNVLIGKTNGHSMWPEINHTYRALFFQSSSRQFVLTYSEESERELFLRGRYTEEDQTEMVRRFQEVQGSLSKGQLNIDPSTLKEMKFAKAYGMGATKTARLAADCGFNKQNIPKAPKGAPDSSIHPAEETKPEDESGNDYKVEDISM